MVSADNILGQNYGAAGHLRLQNQGLDFAKQGRLTAIRRALR
jgi:hypothetical protein